MTTAPYKAADLHNDLVNLFKDLKAGAISAKEAKEMNNAAGKIISLAKVQVEYAALREEKPKLAFLDCADTTNTEES